MSRPTDLEEARREYKAAKSENDYLMERAREMNRADYKRLDELDDDEAKESLLLDIQRRNKELGLYNSHIRLSVAECQLFRAMRAEIKEFCRENGFMAVFEYLDQVIFRNKQIKTNAIKRRELIEICLNGEPEKVSQMEI